MKVVLSLCTLLSLAVFAADAHAQAASARPGGGNVLPPEKARPVKVPRFGTPPVIDGRLDEEVWLEAAVLKDFYQIQPGDNIAPSQPTEVLLGYDAKSLYIAFRAHDEPGKVRATVARRDEVSDDDHVRLLLDTFDDRRRAYALSFNPLGVQQDGIFAEGREVDYSVDVVMESKGTLGKEGYTVEVALPFKSIRYKAGKGRFWGIHVYRSIKRLNNETSSWMPISRDVSGELSQAGRLTGLEDISSERTVEIIPSLTLTESGRRVPALAPAGPSDQTAPSRPDPGRFVNSPPKADPGLTLKYGITPTVTFALALNPDFAQVEADQIVVTANQRFPIFFAEKRPFFLEGIDIFRTPVNVVNTRAIIDPDVAIKLTGKHGRNSFGALLASDNAPGNFTEDERADPANLGRIARFLDKNAYVGVLRLKRDIGKESSLGVVATTYNFVERHNHVGGVDGRFRLNPQTTFSFQVLGTTSRRLFFDPAEGRNVYRPGNGFGYNYGYVKEGRHHYVSLSGSGLTRDYRADVGFTRRTNTNQHELFTSYSSEPRPKALLISWDVNNTLRTVFDWQARQQRLLEEFYLSLYLRRQTTLNIGASAGYERVFEEEFGPIRTPTRAGTFTGDDSERSTRPRTFFVSGETTPSKKFAGRFSFVYARDSFDFDFGAGPLFPRVSPAALLDADATLDPGPGNEVSFSASLKYQPLDTFHATLDYTRGRLTRHDTGLVAFDERIYSLKATYQFTRFTFARGRIDYATLDSNARGQFLVGWAPNPDTSFYAGYNDDLNHHGFNPFTGQREPGFRRNRRTFFVKLSYLIRRSL